MSGSSSEAEGISSLQASVKLGASKEGEWEADAGSAGLRGFAEKLLVTERLENSGARWGVAWRLARHRGRSEWTTVQLR